MPEGDTVRKIADYLRPRLEGRTLETGSAWCGPGPELAGRRVESVEAHGKHLFLALDDGTVLRSHLGMRGSWHRYPYGEAWRHPSKDASIELHSGGQVYVCFRAEQLERFRAGGVRGHEIAARLGPDLLAEAIDLASIVERARTHLPPECIVVDLLLDQRVAAGIGNLYKCEILFLLGVDPRTPLARLSNDRILEAFALARELLQRNVGRGSRGRLWVYGRRGLPCQRCGATIVYARLGRFPRATWWCTRCQSAGAS